MANKLELMIFGNSPSWETNKQIMKELGNSFVPGRTARNYIRAEEAGLTNEPLISGEKVLLYASSYLLPLAFWASALATVYTQIN